MGEASAFGAVLNYISQDVDNLLTTHPDLFTFTTTEQGILSVKDFGTTGVVAFAEGTPFNQLKIGMHEINGRTIRVNKSMLVACIEDIDNIVAQL